MKIIIEEWENLYDRYKDIETLNIFLWREDDIYMKLGTGDSINLDTGEVRHIDGTEMVLKVGATLEFSI